MIAGDTGNRPDVVRTALRVGLYALILFSPLPFGSVQPWALLTAQLWAAVLGLGALWILYRDPESLSKQGRLTLALACGLVLIGVIQMVPVPASWVRVVAEPTADARALIASVVPDASAPLTPMSLSPPDTLDALLRLVMYLTVGLTAAVTLRTRRHVREGLWVIIASGGFQALYGSAEYLSGHQHIFLFAKKHYTEVATGTFINKNHFASYLAMTLPLALGLLFDAAGHIPRHLSWRQRLVRIDEPKTLALVLAGALSFLMWVGVFLSYSRGGLAAALVATAALLFLTTPSRRRLAILVAAFALPAAFLCWQELTYPGERFFTAPSELQSLHNRLPAWRASIPMVADHPSLGTGYGTFESAFLKYKPPWARLRWDYVHSDWLQSLIEGGLAGMTVLLCFGYFAVSALKRIKDMPPVYRAVPAAAWAGIAAVTFHSLLDFSLRIPAIAVLLSFLIGAAIAATSSVAYPQQVAVRQGPLDHSRGRTPRHRRDRFLHS